MSEGDGDARPPRRVRAEDAHLVEERIDSKQVFDGRLLDVRRDRVRLPDGSEAIREYIVHPGAALVVPRLPGGRVVVVRQFRYPVNTVMTEFPAGKIDAGESPLATAQRELREEAGYTAREWTLLGLVHTIVAYTTESIALYLAEGLEHVGVALDDGEFLDVEIVDYEGLLAAVDAGEVTDAKTLAALHFLERRQR